MNTDRDELAYRVRWSAEHQASVASREDQPTGPWLADDPVPALAGLIAHGPEPGPPQAGGGRLGAERLLDAGPGAPISDAEVAFFEQRGRGTDSSRNVSEAGQ